MTLRYFRSLALGIATIMATAPALATQQCPPEFGEKSAWVIIAGWAVLCVNFAIGILLMHFAFRHSRNRQWAHQTGILLAGILVMVSTWFIGLLIALKWFFLTC